MPANKPRTRASGKAKSVKAVKPAISRSELVREATKLAVALHRDALRELERY